MNPREPPLLFVLQNNKDPRRSQADAKTIASHVSARYKPWKKTNGKALVLDSTTKAILKQQTNDNKNVQTSIPTSSDGATGDEGSTTRPSRRLSWDDEGGAHLGKDMRRIRGSISRASAEVSSSTTIFLPIYSMGTAVAQGTSTNPAPSIPGVPGTDYQEYVEHLEEDHQMLQEVPLASNTFPESLLTSPRRRNNQRHILEGFKNTETSMLGSSFLDPFTPISMKFNHEIKSNLHFYFKVIRPFALHLMKGWDWLDNLPWIQASPALAYAVAAYASIFLSGCIKGGPGVVLPSAANEGQSPLWPNPPWFRLHTGCLAELNPLLADPQKVDETCFQAILFLFRVAILLADGKTARMHYQALKRLPAFIGREEIPLEKELAVAKVNIVDAFLHNSSIVMVQEKEGNSNSRVKLMVDIDRKFWQSDRDWHQHQASLAGRLLTLRADGPSEHLQKDSRDGIARIDPQSRLLSQPQCLEMQHCYQIALYFSHSLNAISFNTDTPEIRLNLQILQSKLSQMDLEFVSKLCRCTLFNILLHGAMASRCHPVRVWFVKLLSNLYPDVRSMRNVFNLLNDSIDPFCIVLSTVEEIWEDVLKFRGCTPQSPHGETTNDHPEEAPLMREMQADMAIFQPLDLTVPLETIEAQSLECFADFQIG